MVSDFGEQFVKLEEENAGLKRELAEAKRLAADAQSRVEAADKEKAKLQKVLDKEIAAKEAAMTKIADQEARLHNAVESLLSKFPRNPFAYCLCRRNPY